MLEAAAKAAFSIRDDAYDLDEWEDLDSTERELFYCQARAALAAALAVVCREDAVELAAQAMCATQFPAVAPTYAWNVQFEDGQNYYRQMARAAFAAVTRQAGQS